MKNSKLVVGHLLKDRLSVKSFTITKHLNWIKHLESDEVAEFFDELLKMVNSVSEGKKSTETLTIFLDEWRETALLNKETDVLEDIIDAERELNAGGGKEWSQLKKEIGL